MVELNVQEKMNPKDPNSISFNARKRQIEEEEKAEKEQHQRQKNSPYNKWLQVNNDPKIYKAEDWLMGKSPIAYRIFRFLMTNMDSYNAVMCSYQVLEEQFERSTDTIRKAIKLLKDKKYVDVYKSGTSNVYTINKNIAWNSWGNNFKYGKFGANIVISESEQEERIKRKIKTEKHKEVKLEDNK